MSRLILSGGSVVLPDAVLEPASVVVEHDTIAAIERRAYPAARTAHEQVVDLRGRYVVPGLVDLHNDGLETEINPRPGTNLPLPFALANLDRQLAATGVTTEFHAVFFANMTSKERRLDQAADRTLAILGYGQSGRALVDHQVLFRLDLWTPESLEKILATVGAAGVPLVSLNDHTPGQGQYRDVAPLKRYYRDVLGQSEAETDEALEAQVTQAREQPDISASIVRGISEAARERGLTLMSHDDDTVEKVERMYAAGVRIAEFPVTFEAARLTAFHTLPDTPIGAFQNAKLPGSVPNDRKMLLGGIGSDLWHGPGDAADEFWMVTDRGPNGQVPVAGEQRRTFPIPEFTPHIVKVRAANGAITVLETIPILGQSGKPVTGMSNVEKIDETPYDYKAETPFPFNVNGLDSEGLVRLKSDEFWLAEEYSPSLLKVDPSGKVVKRFVPEGLKLNGADYPVVESLPAIYGKRKINRGFEGLAISPDEKTLFVVLQSPLLNPDTPTGNASRMTRILAFDVATEKPTAEYVYRFEPIGEFDTTAARAATEMKLSGAIALSADSLLILERTDWVAKLYRVDLKTATNILGTKWSDPSTTPTLEATGDPAGVGLTVLPKTLVIALNELAGMPDKIEGIALVKPTTLVVANDNDFDISTFDAAGNTQGPGAKSRMLFITLTNPLPAGVTSRPLPGARRLVLFML